MGKRKVSRKKKSTSKKKKNKISKNYLRIFLIAIVLAFIILLLFPLKIGKEEDLVKKLPIRKVYIPKTHKSPKDNFAYFHANQVINGTLVKYFRKHHIKISKYTREKREKNRIFLYTTFTIKLNKNQDLQQIKDDVIAIIEEKGGTVKDIYNYSLNGRDFYTFYVSSYDKVTHFFSISKPAKTKITGNEPVIAIIIDDCGYLPPKYFHYLKGKENLDLSILPYTPYVEQTIKFAKSNNNEIMLHLPLEAFNKTQNKDKGMILTKFSPKKQLKIFKEDLSFVPVASGFNNHKGSKGTSDAKTMKNILTEAKKYGLFFVDSRTTAKSVGYETALQLGIPTIKRDVFLDNKETESYIINQFHNLFKIAYIKGYAVAICHMRKPTIATFDKVFDEIKALKIKVVPVSYIIENKDKLRINGHKELPIKLRKMLNKIEED